MKAAAPAPIDKPSQTGTDRPHRNEMNATGEPEKYDVLVLGAGTGGKLIAWTMASEGKRTACVERKYIGEACPNIACLPSKNIIHSAKVASLFGRHQEFGIETGPVVVNMAGAYARKKKMVDDLIKAHLNEFRLPQTAVRPPSTESFAP
jgi:pyruvate/2-oxoglutarate dehydrogenase complex dihydrolipoamide dehydrogenase (E3) component